MTDSTTAAGQDKQKRRAILASYLGTTLEYYDFLLYGVAAALVFPQIFFVTLDPLAATLSSFATFAVGYFARPLGAVVFGHYGDRLGRKNVLVVTLILMGLSSMLIGLLPSYSQIGIASPILLVVLRLLQGIAIGGEWGGATLMSMEHAKPRARGLAVSLVSAGGPSGAVLGTLVMTPFTLLPSDQFLAWGWRIPFLLSALLMVLGLIIRVRVTETPEYEAARKEQAAKGVPKAIPLVIVFRHNKGQVLSGVLGGLAPLSFATFAAAFLLNYSVEVGHTRTSALMAMTIANFLNIFTLPLFGAVSDRIGRRPMMIAGAVGGMLLIWPIFQLVHNGSFLTLLLAMVLAMPVIQAMMGGVFNTWISEKFAADVRYSGIALTFQIASTLGAGLSPLIAASLLAASGGTNPQWVAAYFAGICLISCVAYLLGKERFDQELPANTEGVEDAAQTAPVTRKMLA
ncbi:MFS transporter [Bordetella avium]|nr:MFS transporter [Bordetella avium]AZY48158.1 MFS transporter [Bordetella avium]AZY51538.1 MFS transporter [Bordetella avium]RIQ14607.1 MFS transporter [Bordetella avium]RIQ16718.1 MFS transporter [Bordetella avium]RIQ35052.1 MFS transporter [Bordetella avium]